MVFGVVFVVVELAERLTTEWALSSPELGQIADGVELGECWVKEAQG